MSDIITTNMVLAMFAISRYKLLLWLPLVTVTVSRLYKVIHLIALIHVNYHSSYVTKLVEINIPVVNVHKHHRS